MYQDISTIFTIGYEGLQIEQFTNKLRDNSIKVLVDVRKNPISRKKGFSKTNLEKIMNEYGIKYFHLPKLGIDSILRKNLNTNNLETYEELFNYYNDSILPLAEESINTIKKLARENNKVALTCFEGDFTLCHRSRIVNKIKKETGNDYAIQHL